MALRKTTGISEVHVYDVAYVYHLSSYVRSRVIMVH